MVRKTNSVSLGVLISPFNKLGGGNYGRRHGCEMRHVWQLEVRLRIVSPLCRSRTNAVINTNMALHVMVLPTLEGCTLIISVSAVDFDQLIDHTAGLS